MKKIQLVFLFTILFFSITVTFAQKPKDKKIAYEYTVYPWIKYDSNIKTFHVETDYKHDFLKGSLDLDYDTTTHITTYSRKEIDLFEYLQVNGLTQQATGGLKILIHFWSTGDADKVIADYDKKTAEMIKTENVLALMGKMKEKLLFAKVEIFEGANLISAKSFEWKSDYKTEYLEYYKNKKSKQAGNTIQFADKKANALYFIGYNIGFAESDILKFINQAIGTSQYSMQIPIYTAKGRKMDYSTLSSTQTKAINAIQTKNNKELKQCVATWQDLLKKANYNNKKAQYNAAVSAMMLQNCIYACFVTEDFETYNTIKTLFFANKDNMKKSDKKSINSIGAWVEWLEKNRVANAYRL